MFVHFPTYSLSDNKPRDIFFLTKATYVPPAARAIIQEDYIKVAAVSLAETSSKRMSAACYSPESYITDRGLAVEANGRYCSRF